MLMPFRPEPPMSSALLDYLRRQYAPLESDAKLIRRFAADRVGYLDEGQTAGHRRSH